jgi:5-methylcytosine-specific restriction endonuclease McrA
MLKGSKHPEEAKKKMSETKKGKHYSPKTEFKKGYKPYWKIDYSEEWRKKVSKGWFKKGNVPWTKGKKMSAETKRKLSKDLRGRRPWNKGQEMPEETKRKLSKLLKGRRRSPKTEFKKSQHKGSKNPAKKIEIRRKISKAKKGKPHFNQRGENHANWKGGITPKNEKIRKALEYKLWREAVFTRDNWSCQKCGKKGGKLVSHHLYNFADFLELRTSIENGITLCKKCNMEFHKTYGLKNNTKEKFEEFLSPPDHYKKGRKIKVCQE